MGRWNWERVASVLLIVPSVIAIAALTQALVAKLIMLRKRNQTWRQYRRSLINENKWRALRDGIEGKLIDFGAQDQLPFSELMDQLLEFVDEAVEELGTRKEVEYIKTMLNEGTSADRQLACFEREGDLKKVVDQLIEETMEGC